MRWRARGDVRTTGDAAARLSRRAITPARCAARVVIGRRSAPAAHGSSWPRATSARVRRRCARSGGSCPTPRSRKSRASSVDLRLQARRAVSAVPADLYSTEQAQPPRRRRLAARQARRRTHDTAHPPACAARSARDRSAHPAPADTSIGASTDRVAVRAAGIRHDPLARRRPVASATGAIGSSSLRRTRCRLAAEAASPERAQLAAVARSGVPARQGHVARARSQASARPRRARRRRAGDAGLVGRAVGVGIAAQAQVGSRAVRHVALTQLISQQRPRRSRG